MRGGLAVLAAAGLSLLPLAAAAAPQLRALPAWEGAVAAGRVTEIRVTLRSPTAVDVLLSATTPLASIEQPLRLEADTPTDVAVPVRVDGSGIVELVVTGAGEPVLRELALSLHKPGITVVAFDGVTLPDALSVGAPAFAKLPQAYESVRTVVLDARRYDALEPAQAGALAAFASRCGRIALAGTNTVPVRLQEAAGCGGRFVRAVANNDDLASALDSLGDAAAMPGPSALASLAGSGSGLRSWWSVSIFLLLYCGVLVALGIRRASAAALITTTAVTVALSLLIGVRGGSASRATWTVMHNGSDIAREATLLRISGTGRGDVAVATGNTGLLPEAVSGNRANLRRGDDGEQLIIPQRLFSVADFLVRSTRQVSPPLQLTHEGGQVRVLNPGPGTSPAGLLDWRGDVYTLPRLKTGAAWMPDQPATDVDQHSAFRLWRRQAALQEVSALLPDATAGDNAWLMLLPAPPNAQRAAQ